MKKSFILVLTITALVLCLCLAACGLFGKPDNPDNPDDGKTEDVYDVSKLQIGLDNFSYVYDGQAHTPTVYLMNGNVKVATVGKDAPHAELDATYADNVQIGQGSVTVSAKSGAKHFAGSATVYFNITANNVRTEVSDYASLKQRLDSFCGNIALAADVEIPQGEKVNIPANVKLDMGGYSLTNRGELVLSGTLELGVNSAWSDNSYDLTNYGKLVTEAGSQILLRSGGNIVNCGQFEHNGAFKRHEQNFRDNYVYSDSVLSFTSSQEVKVCVREPFDKADVALVQDRFTYTGKAIAPVLRSAEKDVDYTVTCAENVNVGKYDVTFTATKHSKYFYGQVTFNYEITHAAKEEKYPEAFAETLKNPNYSPVTFAPEYKQYLAISVLDGVTVNVSNCVLKGVTLGQNAVLNLLDGVNLALPGTATLSQNSCVNVLGTTVMYGQITGTGRINVSSDGELYFDSDVIKPDSAINNEGKLYADFDLDFVTGEGSKTVRRPLDADELTVNKLDYTGQSLDADVSYEHSGERSFTLSYFFDGDYTTVQKPVNLGDYQGRVTFAATNKYYCGSVDFDFSVSKGKIAVSNTAALLNARQTGNYDRYEIADWQVTAPFEILSGETVIAENVVNNSELTVSGTLSVAAFINGSGKSLTVSGDGILELRGNFCNVDGTSVLSLQSGANYKNVGSGAAYLCNEDDEFVTGQKYVRTGNLADAVFENVAKAVYGVNATPSFDLVCNSSNVSSEEYTVSYFNHSHRTEENGAKITVTATLYSRTVYGKAICAYTVLGGKTTVSTGGELLAALNNTAYGTDLCNWAEIETAAKIYLHENNKQGQVDNYHVGKGTTLVVKHRIEYWDTVPNKDKFSFRNNGVIEFRDGGTIEDAYLWQKDSNGSFKLYASDKSHLSRSGDSATYDYIRLETDIYVDSGTSVTVYASANGVTLDLNGYAFKGIEDKTVLSVYTRGKTVTVLNGAIQPTLELNVGAKYDDSDESGNVVLQNVTHGAMKNASGIPIEE